MSRQLDGAPGALPVAASRSGRAERRATWCRRGPSRLRRRLVVLWGVLGGGTRRLRIIHGSYTSVERRREGRNRCNLHVVRIGIAEAAPACSTVVCKLDIAHEHRRPSPYTASTSVNPSASSQLSADDQPTPRPPSADVQSLRLQRRPLASKCQHRCQQLAVLCAPCCNSTIYLNTAQSRKERA